MNRFIVPLLLALMSPLPCAAGTAFQYDLLQLNAYAGVFEVDGFEGELDISGVSLLYSRALPNRFFFYLRPGMVLLEDQTFFQNEPLLAGVPVDLSIRTMNVPAGLGRYFTFNRRLDGYLAAGVSYNATRLELDVPLLDQQDRYRETFWSGGWELGARIWLDEASRVEFSPYYTWVWSEEKGVIQAVGVGLGVDLLSRFQLQLLFDSVLGDDASLGMGLGLRLYL